MNIRLCKMTKDLNRQYFSKFEHDPDIFMDPRRFTAYSYSQEAADAYWLRQQSMGRIHLAITLNEDAIGEVILKNIDRSKKCCTMGIHMQNDAVKNQGYGTTAERLVIEYAFNELGMETVNADALKKNIRSQHVLRKAGFQEIRQDDTFYYYRCDKDHWLAQKKPIQQNYIE